MGNLKKCDYCASGYYCPPMEFNCVLCGCGPAPALPWEPGPKPETEKETAAALEKLFAECGERPPTKH